VAEVFARPEYAWGSGGSPFQWLLAQVGRFVAWLGQAESSHPAAFRLLLVLASAALLATLVHMGYVVWRITRPTARTPGSGGTVSGAVVEDARAHRERAEGLARTGRYAEALAHRFLALLLDLEQRDALRFHPSKTPAEYVTEARLDPAGRATLGELVGRLYGHVFGAAPCDERTYRAFASDADFLSEHVATA
jgi:uncharacterized protein DUF4129